MNDKKYIINLMYDNLLKQIEGGLFLGEPIYMNDKKAVAIVSYNLGRMKMFDQHKHDNDVLDGK